MKVKAPFSFDGDRGQKAAPITFVRSLRLVYRPNDGIDYGINR